MRIKRILAVIDLESNRSTLDAAFSLAEKFSAELTILHVIDDPLVEAQKRMYPLGDDDEIQLARVEKRLTRLIDKMVTKRQIISGVKAQVFRGKTKSVVRREISSLKIDLLVVGHRPEWRLEHFLSGRKMDPIVNKSSCLVLVVPEPDDNA
jgi:nucleotide-binding universal stress UspA family protein